MEDIIIVQALGGAQMGSSPLVDKIIVEALGGVQMKASTLLATLCSANNRTGFKISFAVSCGFF